MTETEQTSGPTAAPNSAALVRPSTGRVIAGVSQALANRFAVPAWVVRLVFVVLTLSGGIGLVLYVAGWVLIPSEGDARAAAGQFLDRIEGPRAWVGIGLLAVAAIIIADSTRLLDADLTAAAVLIVIGVLLYRGDIGSSGTKAVPTTREETTTMTYETSGGTGTAIGDRPVDPPAPPPEPPVPSAPMPPAPPPPPRERSILGRLTVALGLISLGVMALLDNAGIADIRMRHYLGAAVTVIGIGLLVGSFAGRARGLIVLGVILTPGLLVSPIAEYDFDTTEVRYAPLSVEEISGDYTLDVGRMEIDLSAVDFDGATVELDAEVGMGELIVIIPDDVAVEAYGEVAVGEVQVLGSNSGGLGEISLRRSAEGGNGELIVDARTDLGRVEIRRAAQAADLSDFGDAEFVITDGADLEDSYDLGVGDFVFDLSGLELTDTRNVAIDLGTGNLTVLLPGDLPYEVDASIGLGDLSLPDGERSGVGPEGAYANSDDPLLELDIEVGAGSVTVEEEEMR